MMELRAAKGKGPSAPRDDASALGGYIAGMNKHDPGGPEAKLHYGDNEITILKQGTHVRCAVTGERIPLDELRYWNVDLQEAYRGPAEATQRWKELAGKGS
jgi:hypothetical protein